MSSRYWCFTLNNPTTAHAALLDCLVLKNSLQFLHCSLEKGESGTTHYQGYLELKRHKLRQTVKNLLPGNPHLEPRKGTAKEALTYCLKDVSAEEYSKIPQEYSADSIPSFLPLLALPATITINTATQSLKEILLNDKSRKPKKDERLLDLKTAIDQGKSNLELAELDFPIWLQYAKHFDHYRVLKSKPRNHEVQVIVIQGPSGTGKSKYAADNFPDAYWKQRSNWWDNYCDHGTVVIDEFYGWLPYDMVLRLCDRYPLLVETKGGQVNFVASRIVFTTNQIPDRWYKNVYFQAFIRRVTQWMIMPAWGDCIVTDNYIEAHKHMIDNQIN